MASGAADTLTITFRADPDDDEDDPDKIPCPLGFSGLVIDPDSGPEGPQPPEPPEPPESDQPGMRINMNLEGGAGGGEGGGYSATTPSTEDDRPKAELSIRFHGLTEEEKCREWADRICWRPYPITGLHLDVNQVIYTGTWKEGEALPALSGSYDQKANTITLDDLPGEEDEEGGGKPSFKIMWPTGNLGQYMRLWNVLNNWYLLDYRLRLPDDEVTEEELPPMWVDGPNIPSDKLIVGFGQEQWDYAFRTPVRWSLAAGLLQPGTTGEIGIEEYADWTTPDKAYKPTSKGNGWIQVADDPEPGEEPSSPGIEFNEQGLNAWLLSRGEDAEPLDENEYTLVMEVLPSFGRFNVGGKYLCAAEVRNLHGEYSFYSQQSNLFNAPRVKVPVAYLKLSVIDWILMGFCYSSAQQETFDHSYPLLDKEDMDIRWPKETRVDGAIVTTIGTNVSDEEGASFWYKVMTFTGGEITIIESGGSFTPVYDGTKILDQAVDYFTIPPGPYYGYQTAIFANLIIESTGKIALEKISPVIYRPI